MTHTEDSNAVVKWRSGADKCDILNAPGQSSLAEKIVIRCLETFELRDREQKKIQFGKCSDKNGNKIDEPICGSQLNVSGVVIFTVCDHG